MDAVAAAVPEGPDAGEPAVAQKIPQSRVGGAFALRAALGAVEGNQGPARTGHFGSLNIR